ncbi:hypothetical protein F5Y07DRAFT_405240 [Xylaria sp. FL0933]|nr:hypothetical protein F5Y07DRAFT_405240 [Xylaria sp. FL0933]
MRFEIALAATAAVGSTATPYGRQSSSSSPVQLFNFSTPIPFENSFLASESQLLATSLDSNTLYQINPLAKSPEAEAVAQLPGATAVTGVTQIAPGKFAVLSGVSTDQPYGYSNETVWTVDLNSGDTAVVKAVAHLPDAVLLNGIAALPAAPHVVLITDSIAYCIWRVDTTTGAVDKVIEDATFSVPANASFPLGPNGLKIHAGHAYFTNTGAGLFARVPITAAGAKAGDVEILATVPAGTNFDDFAVDERSGVAYLSQSPGAVVRVAPGGATSFVVGADGDATLAGPTSITLPKGGKKKAYVTTRGDAADGVSGQLWEISL